MNPKYSTLLLDADGTLFDFARAQRQAFDITAGEYGWPEEAYELYSSINDDYWHILHQGGITKRELLVRRFEDLLRALSLPGDPAEINDRYLDNLGEGSQLMPGSEEVCRLLSAHCRLVIATNGVAKTANRRLAGSRIAPYIDVLVASESAGAEKPSPAFFDYLFAQIGPCDKSRTLMVGDMLEADIKGGMAYGLDTCWYNPGKVPAPEGLRIPYIIDSLEKLAAVVLP